MLHLRLSSRDARNTWIWGSVHHSIRHLFIIFTNIFKAHEPFFSGSSFTFFSSPFVPSGKLFVIHIGETPGVLQIKLSYTCFHTLDWYVFYALAWVISFLHQTCIGRLWLRTSKLLGELLYCSEGVKATRLQTIYRGNYFLVTSVQWTQMLASGFLGGATWTTVQQKLAWLNLVILINVYATQHTLQQNIWRFVWWSEMCVCVCVHDVQRPLAVHSVHYYQEVFFSERAECNSSRNTFC